MLVELDIFSGRPNPRWQLDVRGSNELLQLEAHLTTTTALPTYPPGLGYRGFSYADETVSGLAYHGFVKTPRGVLADPSFSIELFLLAQLPAEFAQLRTRIASELVK